MIRCFLYAGAALAALASSSSYATEGGLPLTKAGILIGASAGVPGPGIYGFDQVFTYQGNLTGPGTNALNPPGTGKTGVQAAVAAQGILFVPGWSFLGATYDAVIVQPFVMQSVGSPVNAQAAGVFNTYVVPVELSWKLGASGFVVKAGLGFGLDDGTVTGANGLGNVANPYWTVQPELIVSYLKDGWNVTAAMYEEFNTPNRITHYTTGNILHADFTATKTIDKWTIGPVAYYIGQVTDDSCPASCAARGGSKLAHVQRYDTWSVGGLVGYDFGPASVSVWATKEVYSKASNAAASPDPSVQPMGTTVLATLSYRIWAPDAPAPTQPKLFHK